MFGNTILKREDRSSIQATESDYSTGMTIVGVASLHYCNGSQSFNDRQVSGENF